MTTNTWQSLPEPVLKMSVSSRQGFTASKTHAASCLGGASTWMRWSQKWKASSSVPLFEPASPRLVAAPPADAHKNLFSFYASPPPCHRRMSRDSVSSSGGCWLGDHGGEVGERKYGHCPTREYGGHRRYVDNSDFHIWADLGRTLQPCGNGCGCLARRH